LLLLRDGSCHLRYASKTLEVKIKADSIATSKICILRFFNIKDKKSKLTLVIFKDSVEKALYKKLLVWLKCFGASFYKDSARNSS
jgi:hypothetical protein